MFADLWKSLYNALQAVQTIELYVMYANGCVSGKIWLSIFFCKIEGEC